MKNATIVPMTMIRRLILSLALMAGIAPAFAQVPPPVPALPDTERRTTYSLSSATCACAVGFQLYGDGTDVGNWLTVWVNGIPVPQAGSWTITSPTGPISTIPRPITDAVLTFLTPQTGTVQIVGARRPRRTSQFSENAGVSARDMNQIISDLAAENRELWDRQFRTVQAPPGETINVLQAMSQRAGMGACFDSGGNLIPCVPVASTFSAGTGITFTGASPTSISSSVSAGTGLKVGANTSTLAFDPSYLPGFMGGFAMSNDSILPNTVIDTAAGVAVSDDNTTLMKLGAFTKSTGAWALGTSNGCLDSGSVANSTWYHLFIIARTDTGAADELCSTNPTNPLMPSPYTVKRRVGSFKTNGSGQILAFTQNGNRFLWAATTTDVNVSNLSTTPTLFALNVPLGVKVTALTKATISNAVAAVGVNLYSPDETTPAGFTGITQGINNIASQVRVTTDVSRQIRAVATAASTSLTIFTYGWEDSGATAVPGPSPALNSPPADATGLLQAMLNAGSPVVIPCNGTVWNITGLTIPSGGGSIRGDCPGATLHLTSNATGVTCTGPNSNPINISSLTITGTAANYAGNISDIADLGQRGIHITDCTKVMVRGVNFYNLSGSGLDCEAPSSGFNLGGFNTFSDLSAANTYRGFYTHNSCEYVAFTNIQARNNIFGMGISSGNVTLTGFNFVYNYNNLQVIGESNANPCHATISGGKSNHSNFNLDVLSCSLGLFITGVDFVADAAGSLNTGGALRIANSKGVNIVGGNMGSNISVTQCDPVTSDCSVAGANMLSNTYVRSDIAGFANPSVNYGGGLLMKNNFVSTGVWSQNN